MHDRLRQFWGKADRDDPSIMYPAIYHMLDVAYVALAILRSLSDRERELVLSPFTRCKDPEAVFAWLIALHDIGKLTPGFQFLLPDNIVFDQHLYPEGNKEENKKNHSCGSMAILTDLFLGVSNTDGTTLNVDAAKTLATSVASHHGRYDWSSDLSAHGRPYGNNDWIAVQKEAIVWLAEKLNVSIDDVAIDIPKLTQEWLVFISGLCCVADWLGSSRQYFDFPVDNYDLVAHSRQQKANELVQYLGIKQSLFQASSFQFEPSFEFPPNALQQACLKLGEENPAKLNIIEASMGVGKTEAALVLAHALAKRYDCGGVYFAMPSQASSNQLYNRVLKFIQTLEAMDGVLETHLMHSNAELNPDYQSLQADSVWETQKARDVENNLSANQWFTSRKRGLLAACAVGTIDQLLMAGMQTKHNFVRLFALSNKVVVFDEVHAVDSFQLELLCNLLRWLGKLGAPVVMLSATLPDLMRQKLVAAYSGDKDLAMPSASYPRISHWSCKNGANSQAIKVDSDDSYYYFNLIRCSYKKTTQLMVQNVINDYLETRSGVVACIVNTVRDAQRLYKSIKKRLCDLGVSSDVELILFHARFPLYQRLEIEAKIKQFLGVNEEDRSKPNPNRRKACILIGSQILQESLDYSADKLHTEISPIDLLLQRLGRVHRHKINYALIPDKYKRATCDLYLPEAVNQSLEQAKDVFGFAISEIYPPSILLKTAMLLQEESEEGRVEVKLPGDIDRLVQKVYGGSYDLGEIAKDWEYVDDFVTKQNALIASNMLFDATEDLSDLMCFAEDATKDDDLRVTTRLALPSISVVLLAPSSDGRWKTLCDNEAVIIDNTLDKNLINRFKQSSLSVSHPEWVKHFKDEGYNCEFWRQSASKTLWQKTSLLYGCVPVCLDGGYKYEASDAGTLSWTQELGLCW